MNIFHLIIPLTIAACGTAQADDPVFDIPKIDGVTIDGKGDDWGQNGFRVDIMASESGVVREPKDFDPSFRIGWDERGLLVLLTVRCAPTSEADEPRNLWEKDSVELFFGDQPGSGNYFQVMAGTGADPRFPKLRTFINDLRRSAPSSQKPEVEVASSRTANGYLLEARLPWSNLGIKPRAGEEVAFQLYVNSVTGGGSKLSVTWYSKQDTSTNPRSMARLRLAAKPSLPVLSTARESLDRGRSRVDVVAPVAMAGEKFVAKVNGKTMATNSLEPASGRAQTSFLLPPGDVEISCGKGEKILLAATGLDAAITRAINEARVTFKPAVFSSEQFPPCGFEQPAEVEKSLGACVLTPTFFDADYHEVKTAAKPGRYGAIVQVKTERGQTFKRFITIYRTPEKAASRPAKVHLSSLELAPELGVDPAVIREHIGVMEDYFTRQLIEEINRGPDAAAILAGLKEMKANGETPMKRNSPSARNQEWWYGLKKQTGNLRADYFVHLPETYGNDPEKKWPLILALHGSGERGYDVNVVPANFAGILNGTPGSSCIFIAPQCSPCERWSPVELNDLLDCVEAKYHVDTDRVYLTGLSMGGYGAWELAAESPQRFAAVMPICGGANTEDAERIKGIPIWVFHGGKDGIVPLWKSQEMVDALKKIKGNVKFTVFPEADHNSWTPAYAMPELYDWLLQQRRPEAEKPIK